MLQKKRFVTENKMLPTISPMVLPLVKRPVGFPPEALKSIPLGGTFALERVER